MIGSTPPSPIRLQLWPGFHYQNLHIEPAEDIPADPVEVAVPLYPGSVVTGREQDRPSLSYEATPYLKSAVGAFLAPAGAEEVERWYRDALRSAGFTYRGSGTATSAGVPVARGLHFERPSAQHIAVHLSFQAVGDLQTHVLYVVTAVTLPPRPVDSYLHGQFEQVQITYVPWTTALSNAEIGHPRLHRTLTNADQIAGLVHAINTYPEVAGGGAVFGRRSRGEGAWMVFEPDKGSPTVVELRPAHRLVYVGRSRALRDQWSTVWKLVERIMTEEWGE
jgi:hypothetical protein